MTSHHEVEHTFSPGPDQPVPDLAALRGVATLRHQPAVEQRAVYFDTATYDLLRAGVSLRRRTGGSDEGWHLKVPAGDGSRLEIHRPLADGAEVPPESLRDLAAGWVRGAALLPVATVETHRSPVLLLDADGAVLAEHVDDHVTATTPEGPPVRWREWELELVDGSASLLAEADDLFTSVGAPLSEVSRKIAHVLGDRLPHPTEPETPEADREVSRLVLARLAQQVDDLARQDVAARQGSDDGVHLMRVACRRLRAALATYRPVLHREVTDPVRDEVRWLAGILGQARDAAVVHEELRRLVTDEDPGLVHGPVLERLHQTYAERNQDVLHDALTSKRYFALRTSLDALAVRPPWNEHADEPVRDVVPRLLRKELERYRARVEEASGAEHPTEALHAARKAAKRLRYAAESLEPVAGKRARKLAREATAVTSLLGDLQDTAVIRAELLALAQAAHAAGEPGFTYGLLHGRLERRAAGLAESYWADDPLNGLADRTRALTRELSG